MPRARLDAILPLPEGPGLIVRSVAGGRAHWTMTLLAPSGTELIDLPVTGANDERLRADCDGDRIVLLVGPADFGPGKTYAPSRLIVAALQPAVAAGSKP
jgi:hypothetical protein